MYSINIVNGKYSGNTGIIVGHYFDFVEILIEDRIITVPISDTDKSINI